MSQSKCLKKLRGFVLCLEQTYKYHCATSALCWSHCYRFPGTDKYSGFCQPLLNSVRSQKPAPVGVFMPQQMTSPADRGLFEDGCFPESWFTSPLPSSAKQLYASEGEGICPLLREMCAAVELEKCTWHVPEPGFCIPVILLASALCSPSKLLLPLLILAVEWELNHNP